MPISPARTAAFDILLRVETQDAYARELLHSSLLDNLSPRDRGLTTEIVMGVLRWRSSLDDVITAASSRSLGKLDVEVLTALRIAAYQLQYLTRVPPSAAINESVELVKRARKTSAAPFANAVLRKLADQLPILWPLTLTPASQIIPRRICPSGMAGRAMGQAIWRRGGTQDLPVRPGRAHAVRATSKTLPPKSS